MNNIITCPIRCRHRRRAGFTLIELLVVMLVIVVLAGIVFKAGRALQERGRIEQAKADIARLAMALERYYADHGHYPVVYEPDAGGIGPPDFDVAAQFGAGRGERLWLFLDEDCTYRRDRRAYISGWPKDRLGTTPVRAPGAGYTAPLATVLRYYKDPWGGAYSYTVKGNVEDRGAYLVKSSGPNCTSIEVYSTDNDDIWAGTSFNGRGIQVGR